jgi:O-6-methylguanine DNA methyltransferase
VKLNKETTLTKFELSVLGAALEIPFGETRSYQWIARRIGKPRAVRAVGSALRKNPWPLIIPCHRVIKSDGSLGKYAGKDNGRKKRLIALEKGICKTMKSNH